MSLLNTPFLIGQKTAPNRFVNQPMECNDADEQGNPTDLTFERYRKLAEGGAGIIFVEALTITEESRARKNQLGIYERTAKSLEKLVREMKSINQQSLILFQITHSGRQSAAGFSRLVTVYPTADLKAHVLTEEEIEKIVKNVVESGIKDFDSVMKAVMSKVRGRIEVQTVVKIVKRLIGENKNKFI